MATAYKQYRQAVILLAKFAMTAEQVWQMPVLELSAWVSDYLELEGVKKPKQVQEQGSPTTTQKSFVFTHRGKL